MWADRQLWRDDIVGQVSVRSDLYTMTKGDRMRLRKALFVEQAGICYLCGGLMVIKLTTTHEAFATLDHLTPLTRGGPDDRSNMMLAHFGCNNYKGRMTLEELPFMPYFRLHLQHQPTTIRRKMMDFCIDAEQLRKALATIEAAEKNGFMHCLAVFSMASAGRMLDQNRAEYSDMIEKAHPTDVGFDWGRFQGVSRSHRFKNGKLVRLRPTSGASHEG